MTRQNIENKYLNILLTAPLRYINKSLWQGNIWSEFWPTKSRPTSVERSEWYISSTPSLNTTSPIIESFVDLNKSILSFIESIDNSTKRYH